MTTDARYRQIAEELRAMIESGEIRPGSQLPTELDLRDRYDAARNTVRDAVKLLIAKGLVETRRGQGTFVTQRTAPTLTVPVDPKGGLVGIEGQAAFTEIRARGRYLSASVPRVEVGIAPSNIAEWLCVPAGTQVITRYQEWRLDGMPWSLQSTAYPGTLGSRAPALLMASDIEAGAIAYLEESAGIVETGHRDLILQRRTNPEEARYFRVPDDAQAPVTSVIRIGYRASGVGQVPLRATTSVYLAGCIQFVADSGIVPRADEYLLGN
jgi:GntR family transcriptional regulator